MMKKIIVVLLLLLSTNAHAVVSVDFKDEPIKNIIATVSLITNRNIVYQGENFPLTWKRKEGSKIGLLEDFKEVLRNKNLQLNEKNKVLYVSRIGENYNDETFVFYRLQHLKASQVSEALEIIVGGSLLVQSLQDKILVVTGHVASVDSLLEKIKQVDSPLYTFKRVELEHASVKRIYEIFNQSMWVDNKELTVIPDYWNKAIILFGDNGTIANARLAIYEADIPQKGKVKEVLEVTSIKAETMIEILSGVYPDLVTTMIDDKRLFLAGDASTVNDAIKLCNDLDMTGVQVRIEAVIAYLTEQEYEDLGVRFIASNGDFSFSINDPIFGNSFTLLSEGFESFLNLNVEATEVHQKGSIVSSPVLTVLSGQQAELHVGQNVPYLSQANVNEQDGETTGTSIERADVGVSFSVTPIVDHEHEFVDIQLDQVISSISDAPNDVIDVIFDEQKLKTNVRVADGETIFLGGLSVKDKSSTTERIPFLGYIPLIGEVFSYDGEHEDKRNLVVSLRVKILDS